jgi:choloylglycine hydrolase
LLPSASVHCSSASTYIHAPAFAIPDKKIGDLDFKPLGGGSGMIGLPGDNTPPSRFIWAVAATQTARPTATGYDTKNRVLYYHTQNNRRVRMVDLKKIDFAKTGELVRLPLDKQKSQDIEDVTPRK